MLKPILGFFRGVELRDLPVRVREDIARQQDRSEQIISLIQLAIVTLFGVLFVAAPRPFVGHLMFDLTPWALGLYFLFTCARLVASLRVRLPGWFLALSVVVDMALLMVLIWSFHRTYEQPPSFYLKAPTLLYVFIFISLRALRFDVRYVLLAGMIAVLGWAVLVGYAVLFAVDGMSVTRDYIAYITTNSVLLGAEFDKIVTIAVVTLVIAAAVLRARRTLYDAVAEGTAKRELSRFFDADVARRITGGAPVRPGEGQHRQAAVIMFDIRGFTQLSQQMTADALMQLLSQYQSRVVAVIQGSGGHIDKFLGDGIMATYGAAAASNSFAADALRAVDRALEEVDRWNDERRAAGLAPVNVNAAVTSGEVIFGAVGDTERLEYTVIGDPVNRAAKLEKHAKAENVHALASADTYRLALSQGYFAVGPYEERAARQVDGIDKPVDLIALRK